MARAHAPLHRFIGHPGDAVNKLRLDPHELRIDSFPADAPAREGTTAANAITQGARTCYDCTRFGCPGTALC